MSCCHCMHWVKPEDFKDYADLPEMLGSCALNPGWVETLGRHFCGQIELPHDNFYRQSAIAKYATLNRTHVAALAEEQRERRRLQQVTKELRAQIRELKAEQNKK